MIFNSATYLVFLFLTLVCFRLAGSRIRWVVLLLASYVFYDVLKEPQLLVALAVVTGSTYYFGLKLHAATEERKRLLLWCGIGTNVLVLVALKYIPFLTANLNWTLGLFSDWTIPSGSALISIGVSYFVFQAISYLSDIYLEIEAPEKHFGFFALYMSFFPRLLQGPIERSGDLLPQLRAPYVFNYDNLRFGMLLFGWGVFKKAVLADRLGIYVDDVYGDVGASSGLPLLLGTYAYTLQIYLDFSGYTDMALGSARIFNIRLTPNFDRPYLATSVADFWRRWHITFSRWILDYIFKPLQMSWRSQGSHGTVAALVVTFLVSGIWHGASWGFVVWGLLHGLYLGASVYYQPYQKKLYQALGWSKKSRWVKLWKMFVVFHLVAFAWIFFRAPSLAEAGSVVAELVRALVNGGWTARGMEVFLSPAAAIDFTIIAAGLLLMRLVDHLRDRDIFTWSWPRRWALYTGLTVILAWFSLVNQGKFIYFQF